MTITCPHCNKTHELSNSQFSTPVYNPNDPIQKRGFEDQEWNEQHARENIANKCMGGFRQNPYNANTDEYYRWNRGARAQMKV